MTDAGLPFRIENELEKSITTQPTWLEGIESGRPRHGHPEGRIKFHIAAVLNNIDRFYSQSARRDDLRVVALIHDSFKHRVNPQQSRSGENHHAMIARRFAESIIDDEAVLDVIELHDEAFNAWQCGNRDGRWDRARQRATALLERLGENIDFYLAFYRCDNSTEGKEPDCYDWFVEFVKQSQQEEKDRPGTDQ